MAYRWVSERCPEAKYILKTDDDTFVDVYHLNIYLPKFGMDQRKDFFLCYLVDDAKVLRGEGRSSSS